MQCELHKWTINCRIFFGKKMIHNNHANQNLLNLFKVTTDMPIFETLRNFVSLSPIIMTSRLFLKLVSSSSRKKQQFELKGWQFNHTEFTEIGTKALNKQEGLKEITFVQINYNFLRNKIQRIRKVFFLTYKATPVFNKFLKSLTLKNLPASDCTALIFHLDKLIFLYTVSLFFNS